MKIWPGKTSFLLAREITIIACTEEKQEKEKGEKALTALVLRLTIKILIGALKRTRQRKAVEVPAASQAASSCLQNYQESKQTKSNSTKLSQTKPNQIISSFSA